MKTKVTIRNWPLKKFSAAVKRRMKRVGLSAKAISMKQIEKHYDDMYSVYGLVAKFAKAPKKAAKKAA